LDFFRTIEALRGAFLYDHDTPPAIHTEPTHPENSTAYGGVGRFGTIAKYSSMSRTHAKNYLRTYRLRAALTLAELGALLGISENTLWRYELGARAVPAEVVIASETIFGVAGTQIFPALYNSVDENLAVRSVELQDRLAKRSDAASLKKLALISGIPARLR
jgi:transcriptional regulator with XRE-family HTH domain